MLEKAEIWEEDAAAENYAKGRFLASRRGKW
jgi:hypothetical protein